MMPQFIPGLELSRRFYAEAVHPILDVQFPGLPHAAARIGSGSEVLGFDTEMSTDHDWGPSVLILLREHDAALAGDIRQAMSMYLPRLFAGYPVSVGAAPDLADTLPADTGSDEPIEHRVAATTLHDFIWQQLAYDVTQPLHAADWLTFPSQKLRELIAGAVYYDGIGELTALRERLAFYPHDIWLYLLAAGWTRIGQEEHLMPRAGYVGDELGSSLIGSRLVRDVMTLCFLMERQYAPYPKWFGTAFRQLACADILTSILWRAQQAATWQDRMAALGEAYEHLARMHNALGITPPMPDRVSRFHERPFDVLNAGQFADALVAGITDPEVKRIASRRLIGGIDQISDSTDIRSDPRWRPALRSLYT